jgi:hypothetical protein
VTLEQTELPEPTAPSEPPARSRRLAGLVALGTVFVLSAVGVGTAVGHYGLRGTPTSRPVAKAQPAKPAYGAHSDGDHYGSLLDLLLPEPSGYDYGPDDGGLGDNTVLTRDQYVATFASDFKFLKSSERDQLKNLLDLDHVLGYALRSYSDGSGQYVQISLLQENQNAAKQMAGVGKYLADQTGVFRAGPSIPGHPEAHCYLMPTSPNDPLDEMDCDAYVGDLLVSVQVYGSSPLNQQAVATLLEQQLSRLASPAAQI